MLKLKSSREDMIGIMDVLFQSYYTFYIGRVTKEKYRALKKKNQDIS
jgi:hypothetical protein